MMGLDTVTASVIESLAADGDEELTMTNDSPRRRSSEAEQPDFNLARAGSTPAAASTPTFHEHTEHQFYCEQCTQNFLLFGYSVYERVTPKPGHPT